MCKCKVCYPPMRICNSSETLRKKAPKFTQINIIECTWYTCTETLTWLPIRSKTDRSRAPSLQALELERAATTKWRGSAAEAVMAWSSWRIVLLPSEYLSLFRFGSLSPLILEVKGIILLLFTDECIMVTWDDMNFISEAYLRIDIWNCYQWSNPRSYYPYLNFQI